MSIITFSDSTIFLINNSDFKHKGRQRLFLPLNLQSLLCSPNLNHPLTSTNSSSSREVSEPSATAVTEVEAEAESPLSQQPPSGTDPEKSEGHLEEVRSLRGWGCLGLCAVSH